MGTQLPQKKGTPTPTQCLAPTSVVAKRLGWGCISGILIPPYQDATWYGGKCRLRRRCVRWGRSSPVEGHSPQFSVHVYCGQTAGWMKTPLGTEVDFGLGHIVLHGDPALHERGTAAPFFRPMSIATINIGRKEGVCPLRKAGMGPPQIQCDLGRGLHL